MHANKHRVVYVATQTELVNPVYYRRLWIATRNIPIPRRGWLDEIADTLRDFDGNVLHPNGSTYDIPCVDTTFGDDPDVRWLGYYLLADGSGDYPKIITRKLQRVQLLDLYFRIKYPQIADSFKQ